MSLWGLSHRADTPSRLIADRHYNRQKIGARQFVPPGRCLVLRALTDDALWVTSWPFAQYVKHAWAGAWVNSCFRKENNGRASFYIDDAVAATRYYWPEVPALGIVSFVDPAHVPPIKVRGQNIYGYCYMRARWKHVGFTKAGLWVWQQLEAEMPAPRPAARMQLVAPRPQSDDRKEGA